MIVKAHFDGRVFIPCEPVDLPVGQEVSLEVEQSMPSLGAPKRSPAEILAKIAALPTRGGDPNTGRDHDQVLYGESGAR